MDEYLRRLERNAQFSEEARERLRSARLRVNLCPEHGLAACEDVDCILLLGIIRAWHDNEPFFRKWRRINDLLEARRELYPIINFFDNEEAYRHLNRVLFEAGMYLRIFWPSQFIEECIEYSPYERPYCGSSRLFPVLDSLQLSLRTLIISIYDPEDIDANFASFAELLDGRIVETLANTEPLLTIEKVLQEIPNLESSLGFELIQRAKAALFIGKRWKGWGHIPIGKNQRDILSLGCLTIQHCYDDWHSISTQLEPGSIIINGYSDERWGETTNPGHLVVNMYPRTKNNRGLAPVIKFEQRLNSDTVIFKTHSHLKDLYKEVDEITNVIYKLRNQGMKITIRN
jgi:hypothetical protein